MAGAADAPDTAGAASAADAAGGGLKRAASDDGGGGGGGGGAPKRARAEAAAGRPYSFSVRVESAGAAPPAAGEGGEGGEGALGESPPALKTYCSHDVSLPAGFEGEYEFEDAADGGGAAGGEGPAKVYPFELDAFQKESIRCIERGENVLVAAHTSAGKTVVAEYAIALCLKRRQRVIYTSPIKALSNQKFREFSEEYSDVGLMTGDVTINKNASCLIMTTEIYRSMLYRGSEVVREVAWVIFDEVHAMRSKDRGTVWEESFILSPENVHFVFLSATIPNAREFSEWIAKLKAKPCHTIYTDTRPVPLKHFLFPKGGDGLHLVLDEKRNFRPDSFELAMNAIGGGDDGGGGGGGGGKRDRRRSRGGAGGDGAPGDKSDCFKVIKMIMERNFYPVIVFAFARRECETLALQMSKLDFNSDDEKELVRNVYQSAIESLMEQDRALPQIAAALPLLERGIGIHHSGLLPVVKEVVEILFQEGLIKALFATETFSMGLNMPAKTVVFKELRKYDGETTRFVSSGEYVQMSGRAGRRGLDQSGIAILMCEEKMEPKTTRDILCGTAEPLNSSFKLGYNMLLNLLRAEEANPEYVMARSFAQFQGDRHLPESEAKVAELEAQRDAIVVGGPGFDDVTEKDVKEYYRMREYAEKLRAEIRDYVHKPEYVVPFLQGGRLARVRDVSKALGPGVATDYGWGVIIKSTKRAAAGGKKEEEERYSVDILVRCAAGSGEGRRPRPFKGTKAEKAEIREDAAASANDNGVANGDAPSAKTGGKLAHRLGKRLKPEEERTDEWIVLSFSLRDLDGVSALRVYKPDDLRSLDNRASVGSSVREAMRRFPDGPPLLDPLADMEIAEEAFVVLLRKVEAIDAALAQSPVTHSKHTKKLMASWKEKAELNEQLKEAKFKVKLGQGLIFKEELKRMKRILRRLGFITDEGVIEVKGKLACEVSSGDELVITELMLGGKLNSMSPEILVALCSCFVVDEAKKDSDDLQLEKELDVALDELKAVCTRVATVTKESKIPIDVEEYVDSFSPVGMRVVYHWCLGKSFAEVCSLTQMFEGSIVRCMRRLEELLRQLVAAAKSIGNTDLEEKIEAGSEKLKRGIAFQSSLYT